MGRDLTDDNVGILDILFVVQKMSKLFFYKKLFLIYSICDVSRSLLFKVFVLIDILSYESHHVYLNKENIWSANQNKQPFSSNSMEK